MRYLQFNDICIDTHNQLLIKSGERLSLAPKVYDLLVFFCHNAHRVISKDELMDKVWSGTIVTENAISRTLVKVRKALGDDPKNPNYIITVPKVGYRMVAEFVATDEPTQIDDTETNTESLNQPVSASTQVAGNVAVDANNNADQQTLVNDNPLNNSRFIQIVAITLLLIVVCSVWYGSNGEDQVIETKQITPLTRDVASEFHPAVSPDLTTLAYTKQTTGQPAYINIEHLTTKTKQSLLHPRAALSKPVWSPSGDKLAFLYQHNDVCTIYWAALNDIKNRDTWQAISECGAQSSPLFAFSPNGQHFYFNDRQSNTNGYQVFRVDLTTLQKDIVNQPITSGRGNYGFDISPDGERLVLLNSEFAPQTRIYTLDISDSLLTQTAQLPYLMRSVRWAHDGKTLLHPSPHPAYEIWQSNLAGDKLSVFASNTSRVKHISRINNGQDFSFVSYLLNRDIYYQRNENNAIEQPLDNSSVMDYLPTLANHSKQYAFVSKRSTTAEVYLSTVATTDHHGTSSITESAKRLTFFNDPVKIYQLVFSPNDSQLLILADNQLFIVNLLDTSVQQLPLNNVSIHGASWKDENTLLFSTIKNNEWYAVQYNLTKQALEALPVGYQGAIFIPEHNSYYLVADDSGQVVKFDQTTNNTSPINLRCLPSFSSRKLNLMATSQGLMCLSEPTDKLLSHYLFDTQTVEPLQNLPNTFDLNAKSHGAIYTKMTQSVADIMRTSTK